MKRFFIGILLVAFAAVAFYYSMFWGWASGAGNPPNAEGLKRSSDIAFWISCTSFVGALFLWFYPKRKKERGNQESKSSLHSAS